MERIWAPWRLEYILDHKPSGCIFCIGASSRTDRDNLVLHRTALSLVLLNRYPYTHGHLLIPPLRHVADLELLSAAELHDLFDLASLAGSILKACISPDGMNIGMNIGAAAGAGVADHLHVHVVPRWAGDTNFIGVIADVKVMPENLLSTYDRLLPGFAAHVKGDSP